MAAEATYINVIVPLKLSWEPFYVLSDEESVEVGDRVAVPFAGRRYIGVVSAVGSALPQGVPASSVKEIYSVHSELGRILPSEIGFWRSLADYYMCSVGEVYKAAYPSAKDETPSRRSSRAVPVQTTPRLAMSRGGLSRTAADAFSALSSGKPLLLGGEGDESVLIQMCRSVSSSVLWLVPEMRFGKALQERMASVFGQDLVMWDGRMSPAKRRQALARVRSGEPYIVLGTRSALLLPHNGLGLVIVQDEHEPSYKQASPAPRYNGRDAAVLLASLHKCPVVLQSNVPSLDSVYNVLKNKYVHLGGGAVTAYGAADGTPTFGIIDTRAELRKNGMVGDVSRKMMEAAPTAFYKPRRAMFPKMKDLAPQLKAAFGENIFITDDLVENPLPPDTRVLGIFGIDSLLGRSDFRSDERALQTVCQAMGQCRGSLRGVLLQTREPSHPVFACLSGGDVTPLLEERRSFGYPPFTRIVDVVVRDSDPQRLARMSEKLLQRLSAPGFGTMIPMEGGVRALLPRDRFLTSRKATLASLIEDFEKIEKYVSHIHVDVDPQFSVK